VGITMHIKLSNEIADHAENCLQRCWRGRFIWKKGRFKGFENSMERGLPTNKSSGTWQGSSERLRDHTFYLLKRYTGEAEDLIKATNLRDSVDMETLTIRK